MVAEILSVGTELLLGEIVDTNAAFLSSELSRLGVTVRWRATIGDNLERMQEAITRALDRSDFVILSGGLGPTDDDMTREAIAGVLHETPVVDDQQLDTLRAFFTSRGREMPALNLKQAWVTPSVTPLPNPNGTAPGWLARLRRPGWIGRIIIALPGPPHEMQPMWREQVLPRLILPPSGFYARTYRTFLIGEGDVATKLGDLTKVGNPSVATYARRDGVHVRVAASAPSLEEAHALAAPVEAKVRAALARFIYGQDDENLPLVLGRELLERSETVAALESLTGGLVLDELTNVPGASAYVLGGAVTYTLDAKRRFGVSAETLEAHGAVSRETAAAMAEAARDRFGATWGVSTTGVAGPEQSEGKPVGLYFVGVAGPTSTFTRELRAGGGRRAVKERAAITAIGLLWTAVREADA